MNKIYGEWITCNGERIICEDQCSHSHYADYGDASDEGWVAIAYGQQFLSIRLNPATTSRKAYNVVLKIIKEHDGELVLLEDVFANSFGNIDSQDCSKKYITRIIQKLKTRSLILTERFDDHKPYRGYATAERKRKNLLTN